MNIPAYITNTKTDYAKCASCSCHLPRGKKMFFSSDSGNYTNWCYSCGSKNKEWISYGSPYYTLKMAAIAYYQTKTKETQITMDILKRIKSKGGYLTYKEMLEITTNAANFVRVIEPMMNKGLIACSVFNEIKSFKFPDNDFYNYDYAITGRGMELI